MRSTIDILIVDDEAEIVHLLTEVLSDEGYTVRSASDGISAIDKVATFRPSMVLLDYSMPGMSGAEVLQQLQVQGYADLSVVIMSASTRLEAMRVAGAIDFLAKPFDLTVLLDCVRRYVHPGAAPEQV